MATRSFIALRTHEGITAVYCHWDGYLACNGRILHEHYSDGEKLVELLLSLGGMSALGPSIGSKHEFFERRENETTFYHRDRGEPLNVHKVQSLDELLKDAAAVGAEYVYVFDCTHDKPQWLYAERGAQYFGLDDGSPFSDFQPLAPALARELRRATA